MGWLFVQGSEGWSSDSISHQAEPLEPFVTSSGKPQRRPSLWPGWKKRPWIRLLSGTISNPSMAARGVEIVDLVSAGYPCQPFSNAGKRRGEDDERHLWPHVARVLGEVGPSVVVLENVSNHVRLGLDTVLGQLASLGFDSEWGLFSAAEVGAPHRRERVFVLAWRVSDAGRDAVRLLAERGPGAARPADARDTEPGDVGEQVADAGWRGGDGFLGDTNGSRWRPAGRGSQQHAEEESEAGRIVVGEPDGIERDVRLHSGRGEARGAKGEDTKGARWERAPQASALPLWPPGPTDYDAWRHVPPAAQPALRGMAHGSPSRLDQLRALGNGVVPLAAAHALRTLATRALT